MSTDPQNTKVQLSDLLNAEVKAWAETHTHLTSLCKAAGVQDSLLSGSSDTGLPTVIELSDLLFAQNARLRELVRVKHSALLAYAEYMGPCWLGHRDDAPVNPNPMQKEMLDIDDQVSGALLATPDNFPAEKERRCGVSTRVSIEEYNRLLNLADELWVYCQLRTADPRSRPDSRVKNRIAESIVAARLISLQHRQPAPPVADGPAGFSDQERNRIIEENGWDVVYDKGLPAAGHESLYGPEPGQPSSWFVFKDIDILSFNVSRNAAIDEAIRAARKGST